MAYTAEQLKQSLLAATGQRVKDTNGNMVQPVGELRNSLRDFSYDFNADKVNSLSLADWNKIAPSIGAGTAINERELAQQKAGFIQSMSGNNPLAQLAKSGLIQQTSAGVGPNASVSWNIDTTGGHLDKAVSIAEALYNAGLSSKTAAEQFSKYGAFDPAAQVAAEKAAAAASNAAVIPAQATGSLGREGQATTVVQRADGTFSIVGANGQELEGGFDTISKALAKQQERQGGSTPQPVGYFSTPVVGVEQPQAGSQGQTGATGPSSSGGATQDQTGATGNTSAAETAYKNAVSGLGFSVNADGTVGSDVYSSALSNPVSNLDIQKMIDTAKAAQDKYLASLPASEKENSLQQTLKDIRAKADQVNLEAQAGINEVTDQPIAMGFITGQAASIERRANTKLQTLSAQEKNVLTELGLEQAAQKLETDGLKDAVVFAQQNQQMITDLWDKVNAQQDRVLTRAMQMETGSRQTLGMILDNFKGLTLDQLDATAQGQVGALAAKAGIPISLVAEGMKVVANQQAATALTERLKVAQANQQRIDTRVDALAKDFRGEETVKQFNQIAQAQNFVRDLDTNTNNPGDDIALVYAFAKAMDPGSVVREGEYATVQNNISSFNQMLGAKLDQVISGNGFLDPAVRQKIKNTIESKYGSAKSQYDSVQKAYATQIDRLTGKNDGDSFLLNYSEFSPVTLDSLGNNFGLPTANAPANRSSTTGASTTQNMAVQIGNEIRQGGSAAWRNNNPGNIKFSDDAGNLTAFAKQLQAQGINIQRGSRATDGGYFIAFPDQASGQTAMRQLLTGGSYAPLTVDQALKRWSNSGYGAEIAPSIAKTKQIASLTPSELDYLIRSMQKTEGWTAGEVKYA